MVTHDSRLASRCGRVLYLVDGQIYGEMTFEADENISNKEREDKLNQWLAKMEW